MATASLGLSLFALQLVDGPKGDRVVLRRPSEVTQTGEPKGIAKGEMLFLPLDI